ncbi:MAG: CsiV family protein [Methylococcaceae bacterium]|jgi:hypothetical protein|nr:CsiV family protein [Methylococcaceae bacterium]MDZ4155916.1 CsiV family protein [Methylococcales bacterium]MDP2392293.1 CsiV family protein [Methylococcaceae bacterium]MDP3019025.1 CsiV family protein [Methylococcaceae bacterium]MDP3391587.1 CsiV family protein [Methylococcaceae bacterium]
MITTRALLFSLVMGLFSGLVLAEARAYQVELIVFTQDFPNTELFDQTESKITWPAGITEISDQQRATNTTLDESLSLLSKSPNYRVIKYASWVQKLTADSTGVPVRIRSADGQLNGYLQLLQEQTLRVEVDLEYPSGQSDSYGNMVLYRLNEKRSIKLDDIYYLDHPRIGAILKVTGL